MTQAFHRFGSALGIATTLALVACGSSDDDSPAAGSEAGASGSGSGGSSSGNLGGAAGADTGSGGSGGDATTAADVVDTATAAGDFTALVGALEATSLTEALRGEGPFTVFAPTDDAFEDFEEENPGVIASLSTEELAAVLTYHVVPGAVAASDLVDGSLVETLNGARAAVELSDGASVAGASVTETDIVAANGIIHVIDRLMLPPSRDIVETAVAAGSFTTLATALVATGLDEVLQGDGPYTVFAPTDEAFAAFEAANPGVLASLSTEALTDVLLYHVVGGWAGPADLEDGMALPTELSGASLTVSLDGGVQIDDANVTAANIVATNGVIHVIDAVMLPASD